MQWIVTAPPQLQSLTIQEFTSRDEIKGQSVSGFYLYYAINNFCVRDDLQDTFEKCVEQAEDLYNVSSSHWQKITDNPATWAITSLPYKIFDFSLVQDQQQKFRLSIKYGAQQIFLGAPKNLDNAKDFAEKNFHIPIDAWQKQA